MRFVGEHKLRASTAACPHRRIFVGMDVAVALLLPNTLATVAMWCASPIIEPTWWCRSWMRPTTAERLVPTTGYDEDAARIGSLRSGTRPWWFKLMVLACWRSSFVDLPR